MGKSMKRAPKETEWLSTLGPMDADGWRKVLPIEAGYVNQTWWRAEEERRAENRRGRRQKYIALLKDAGFLEQISDVTGLPSGRYKRWEDGHVTKDFTGKVRLVTGSWDEIPQLLRKAHAVVQLTREPIRFQILKARTREGPPWKFIGDWPKGSDE